MVIFRIFVLLVIGILIWILAYIFAGIWDWRKEFIFLTLYFFKTPKYRKLEPCLAFSQFLSFYTLNPKKWTLYYDFVSSRYSNCDFSFTTYGELYKYRRWKKKKDNKAYKERALENLNEKMGKLTEGVHAEIEKANANAEAEAKAREAYEEVRKRCE